MSELPFGKTRTTPDELRTQIDTAAAVRRAREGGVSCPEQRIDRFIQIVPDLLEWLENHGREYPWRHSSDAWEVYIAEILLQRTRGDAVAEVYSAFLDEFPDPDSLANATEEDIRQLVEPLGFVNHRTRTLKEVGKLFSAEFDGDVPDSVEELKRPWRAGEYSARACQMFARGKPMALVDANFARVIGRVLGYEMPVQPHKSSAVYGLLETLLPTSPELARAFNLAILDLGALICTAEHPDCKSCPINRGCVYYCTRMEDE
ncbi:A/G-specific adenine glycosylase [Halalkaliarchaeum desulfuricum]|uniref:A/G-specific adenine glycosylase n=1 Tax=Halalkaliarchaeum desulfuricum TaxID=2055893 RepID=A0A343TJI8_9EURY|nr:hypothetical protein [Halalkaliarchaeum desulfuricum]AUX09260.1 A/G-specific adenine glycosylase [Halalkaliarchaeum desulfuricum]